MGNNVTKYVLGLVIILALIIGYVGGYYFASEKIIYVNKTITREVKVPVLKIEKLKGELIYRDRHDTVRPDPETRIVTVHDSIYYASKPYVQKFDTTLQAARVMFNYWWPEKEARDFSVVYKPIRDTFNIQIPIKGTPLFWQIAERVAYFGAGIYLGNKLGGK